MLERVQKAEENKIRAQIITNLNEFAVLYQKEFLNQAKAKLEWLRRRYVNEKNAAFTAEVFQEWLEENKARLTNTAVLETLSIFQEHAFSKAVLMRSNQKKINNKMLEEAKETKKQIRTAEIELKLVAATPETHKQDFDWARETALCQQLSSLYQNLIYFREKLGKKPSKFLQERVKFYNNRYKNLASEENSANVSDLEEFEINNGKPAVQNKPKIMEQYVHISVSKKRSILSILFKQKPDVLSVNNPQFKKILHALNIKSGFFSASRFDPTQLVEGIEALTEQMAEREIKLFSSKSVNNNDKAAIFGEKFLLLCRQLNNTQLVKLHRAVNKADFKILMKSLEYYRDNAESIYCKKDHIFQKDARFDQKFFDDTLPAAKARVPAAMLNYLDSMVDKIDAVLDERKISVKKTKLKDFSILNESSIPEPSQKMIKNRVEAYINSMNFEAVSRQNGQPENNQSGPVFSAT